MDRLAALLAIMNGSDMEASFDRNLGHFDITYTDDRAHTRKFTMPIEPDALWGLIQVTEADRDALWPDASTQEASLRLFSVHLMEAVMVAREGQDVLVKVAGGIRAVPRSHVGCGEREG
ncbi:hypothetical protein OHC50_02225 [Paenarthrobacter ilicis]|uniref:hypothetical protein n=1 Tax=Paenarthrobacter ilicis TaxID=43665 RepID=UPI003009CD0F